MHPSCINQSFLANCVPSVAIDLTVFSEFLPKKNRYLLTTLASMWGIGNAVGGLIGKIRSSICKKTILTFLEAWPLIANFSCPSDATPATCPQSENRGWRYQYITIGGLCLIMAIFRAFIFKLEESPRWLVSQGRMDAAVAAVAEVARVNKSDHVWSHDSMQTELIAVTASHGRPQRHSPILHIRGLFANATLTRSSLCVFFLWMGIGIA